MTRLLHKSSWQRTAGISARGLQSVADARSCHRPGLLQIQVIPLQLFNPTVRLALILAFISSRRIIIRFFFCFPQCSVWKDTSDQDRVNRWVFHLELHVTQGSCSASSHVSQWHTRRQEMGVNKRPKKHTSLSLISDTKGKMSRKKDFPPQPPYNEQLSDWTGAVTKTEYLQFQLQLNTACSLLLECYINMFFFCAFRFQQWQWRSTSALQTCVRGLLLDINIAAGSSTHYHFLFNPQTKLADGNDDYLQVICSNMPPDLIPSVVHGASEPSMFGGKRGHELIHKGEHGFYSL